MAEKELRKMNRTELVEIIYALQQNERSLREENEKLHKQLDDRLLRLEQAGSIAEAALSLNHIFEDAENAAQQYLLSLKEKAEAVVAQGNEVVMSQGNEAAVAQGNEVVVPQGNEAAVLQGNEVAMSQENDVSPPRSNDMVASQMLAEAREKSEAMISEAEERLRQTEEECRAMREAAKQEIQNDRAVFIGSVRRILERYPELDRHMREETEKRLAPDMKKNAEKEKKPDTS